MSETKKSKTASFFSFFSVKRLLFVFIMYVVLIVVLFNFVYIEQYRLKEDVFTTNAGFFADEIETILTEEYNVFSGRIQNLDYDVKEILSEKYVLKNIFCFSADGSFKKSDSTDPFILSLLLNQLDFSKTEQKLKFIGIIDGEDCLPFIIVPANSNFYVVQLETLFFTQFLPRFNYKSVDLMLFSNEADLVYGKVARQNLPAKKIFVSRNVTSFNLNIVFSLNKSEIVVGILPYFIIISVVTFLIVLFSFTIFFYLYKRLDLPLEKMAEQCLQINKNGIIPNFETSENKPLAILADTLNETFASVAAYQKNLEIMAFTDPLLGIGNRSACIRDIEGFIKKGEKDFSIFMVDIVDFGQFNELFSSKTGDIILRKTAEMMETIPNCTTYRYDGDVFLLLSHGAEGTKAEEILYTLKKFFSEPVKLATGSFSVTMNSGRADYPDHGSTSSELLRNCKTALKYSKSLQEANICIVYNEIINDAICRTKMVKEFVIDAIKTEKNIEVAYQPVYSTKQEKFTQLEALLRIKNERIKIDPAEAVQIAEENGLIAKLGAIVLKKVCEFAKELRKRNSDIELISINLSIIQLLQHDFDKTLPAIIEESEVPFSFFAFEVTEDSKLYSFETVLEMLNCLKKHGFHLTLDNFGSVYSGLNYLSELPVDSIKIDKKLIVKMITSPQHNMLIKSVVDICRNFNLRIVIEGIESQQTLDAVKSLDADYIQGFYQSMPMYPARVFAFMDENRYLESNKKSAT